MEHRTDTYWLFDLMTRYEVDDRLSATLNVGNLFDKRCYTIFGVYSTTPERATQRPPGSEASVLTADICART